MVTKGSPDEPNCHEGNQNASRYSGHNEPEPVGSGSLCPLAWGLQLSIRNLQVNLACRHMPGPATWAMGSEAHLSLGVPDQLGNLSQIKSMNNSNKTKNKPKQETNHRITSHIKGSNVLW